MIVLKEREDRQPQKPESGKTSSFFYTKASFFLLFLIDVINSNAHYVGYVEDGESVEAIMKKFEELERIQQEFSTLNVQPNEEPISSSIGSNIPAEEEENKDEDEEMSEVATTPDSIKAQFTQEQLEEVFKRTSAFTVRSATIDTSAIADMDALDLWQVEYKDGSTSEFYEEE